MRLIERYRRLTLWNKIAVWGSVTSFLGIALFFVPSKPAHDPVVEARVERGKIISIFNRGPVVVEELVVFGTTYRLKSIVDDKQHRLIAGIESFSKVSTPVFSASEIPANGGKMTFDLRSKSSLFPLVSGLPTPREPLLDVIYCFRVEYRDANSKKRHSLTLLTGALLDMPDIFGDHSNSAIGGGFEAATKISEITRSIREHQASLFQ